jgi:hypothetical protein
MTIKSWLSGVAMVALAFTAPVLSNHHRVVQSYHDAGGALQQDGDPGVTAPGLTVLALRDDPHGAFDGGG